MWARIAWRLFWQELRRGELWVIAFALFLAVCSVVVLSGITQSVKSALMQRSAQFIAADKVLNSSQPFDEKIFDAASRHGLLSARQLSFDSMLFASDNMQLVSIKAVNDAYPLRGRLELKRAADAFADADDTQMKPGEVWLEGRLFSLLNVKLGDTVEIGVHSLLVAGVIVNEPDAPMNIFGGQPRVIMHFDDVAATEIIQPGSRIRYRYLFAGDEQQLLQFENELTPSLTPHQRWQNIDRESALGSALERAERFLLLAGLLGIVLAACAAAVAAARYGQRHTLAVATVKALGASTAMVRRIYGSHLLLVLLFSLIIGIATGLLLIWASQIGIRFYLSDYQAALSWRPLWLGALTGICCALLFAARPLWRLTRTAAIDVLKQPAPAVQFDLLQLITGAVAIWGLMWLFSGELLLSIGLFVLCAAFSLILMLAAALFFKLARPMAAGQHSATKLALANLRRRLWPNSFQLITFTLAIFLTLLLYFLRAELIGQWQQQVPQGAPNQFLVNVAEHERLSLQQFAEHHQIEFTQFYPVVPGRLLSVNDKSFQEQAARDENTAQQAGVGRELNLTWLDDLPPNNRIVSGQWFSATEAETVAEVSVEVQLAERLGVQLGDVLQFSIGGQEVTATITSIREVDWNSLQPNFYMILSPALLANFPATYITAFYNAPDNSDILNQLARQYPTVMVLTLDTIIKQVNDIIEQVTIALSFILLIIALAAALVLIAQVQATLEQREMELAILRTLGARYAFLRNAILMEFMLLGFMAGLFATILAEILLFVLQQRAFNLPFTLHYTLWWMGPVLGMVIVTTLGWWQLKRLLSIPGVQLIRRVLQS